MKRLLLGMMLATAASPLFALEACSSDAEAPSNGSDASSSSGAMPIAEAGAEASASETSTGDPTIPDGVTVDGIACTDVLVTSRYVAWPKWTYSFRATCGGLGSVSFMVSSRGDFPYPQSCGVATTVSMFIPNTASDVGPFVAGTAGTCSIVLGPSVADDPPTGLVLAATTPGEADPTVIHHVTVRIAAPDCTVPATQTHRPSANACPATRPPGDTQAYGGDTCTSDADCTNGTNGRCTVDRFAISTEGVHRACSYDACHRDSDCASGVCQCGRDGSPGMNGENVCLTNSDCKVDGDCASGRCALSAPYPTQPGNQGDEIYPPGINHGLSEARGYFCTTPKDNCCSAGSGSCTYDWTNKRWAWGYGP